MEWKFSMCPDTGAWPEKAEKAGEGFRLTVVWRAAEGTGGV